METRPDVSEFSLTHNSASMWYLFSDKNELLFIPSLLAQPFLIHTPLNTGQKGLAGASLQKKSVLCETVNNTPTLKRRVF